jgi:rod shape determining protein RodA
LAKISTMIQIDRRIITHFDFFLLLLIVPIALSSLFLISEVNEALAKKELAYIVMGIGVLVFMALIPIRKLTWLIPIVYWVDILLLVSVKFFGISILGAQRWLEIPFTSMTLQPSEIIKPALLLMLAYQIQKNPPPDDGYDWKAFAKISVYIILPFFLIAIEPDLGSASVVLMLGFGVLFLVGVKWRIWAILLVCFLTMSTLLYEFGLRDYQKQRIEDFIAEKPSYHVQQSIIAIGSGGLFGKDKEDATQVQLKFLPIATTDFIFAYHVERFGFFGALMLIVAYAVMTMHVLGLRSKFKNDYFGVVFASGIGVLIFVYSSINIAMTIGLAPVVGIPLPMYSYGGTSFITFMILFGILENLLAFRFNFLYNSVSFSKRKR